MPFTTGFQHVIELTQQVFLLPVEINRCLDLDFAEQISDSAGAHILDALTLQPKDPLRLTFRRDFELCAATQCRNLDLSTQRHHRNTDRHLTVKVIPIPRENGMLANSDLNVQISASAHRAPLSLSRQPDLIALIHARGDLDLQGFGFLNCPAAAAVATRRLDHRAAATAIGAGLLDREKSLLHSYLSLAVTGGAGDWRGSWPCPRAGTGVAANLRGNSDT